jgi:hypothetical protein
MSFEFSFSTMSASFNGKLKCAPVEPGTVEITITDGLITRTLTDNGLGVLVGDGEGVIDYSYGLVEFIVYDPLTENDTPILATYTPIEGGCYDLCSKCPTNKIKLELTPAAIAGQDEISIHDAYARLIKKIQSDVLPFHVEILSDSFSEEYTLEVGRRFDLIPADSIELDKHGMRLILDSGEW